MLKNSREEFEVIKNTFEELEASFDSWENTSTKEDVAKARIYAKKMSLGLRNFMKLTVAEEMVILKAKPKEVIEEVVEVKDTSCCGSCEVEESVEEFEGVIKEL